MIKTSDEQVSSVVNESVIPARTNTPAEEKRRVFKVTTNGDNYNIEESEWSIAEIRDFVRVFAERFGYKLVK